MEQVKAEEIYEPVIDNDTLLLEMNLPEYSIQELCAFFKERSLNEILGFENTEEVLPLTILDVNQEFPIKCLRCTGSMYTVYKVQEGGYFYVFWIYPQGNSERNIKTLQVFSTVYLNSLKKEKDFDEIKPGISTAQDVYEIDPGLEFYFLGSSPRTYSLLDNNKVMLITYSYSEKLNNKQDLIVREIMVIPFGKESIWLETILPEDLPAQDRVGLKLLWVVIILCVFAVGTILLKMMPMRISHN